MTKLFCAMRRLALPLVVCTFVLPGMASAWESLVCYRWTGLFPNERTKLAIRSHSDLTTWDEEWNFGHPHQVVMPVVGKDVGVCGDDTVRADVGTIVATDPLGGARLGFEILSHTGFPSTCRNVNVSCRASNISEFPPPVWDCFARNDFGLEFPEFQLVKVDEATDERCSKFESTDGGLDGIVMDGIVNLLGAQPGPGQPR